MAFIQPQKMKQLRESAKGGDERAIKIIKMQLNGEDFSSLLDDYFKPAPEPGQGVIETKATTPNPVATHKDSNANLLKFLEDNGVKEDSDEYDGFVEDFYREFPNEKPIHGEHCEHCEHEQRSPLDAVLDKLIGEEMDAIRSYSDAILEIMNTDCCSDNEKRGILSRLEEIKRDETEHYEELKRLKTKKEEKEEGIVE